MDDWVSDLLIFCGGIAAGVLLSSIKPYLTAARHRRTQLAAARARMLTDLKEKHDEEILEQAFRTTEAIRGELDKSLDTLRKTIDVVMPVSTTKELPQNASVIQLTEPTKTRAIENGS